MHNESDTPTAGSAPARQGEAGVMNDWTEIVALIGAHPALVWREMSSGVEWAVRLGDGELGYATPATVDALMLAHCTAWLDRVIPEGIAVVPLGPDEFYVLRERTDGRYPTRLSATVAAVKAAKGASHERGEG